MMEESKECKLRIVVGDGDYRKLTLPDEVTSLIDIIRQTFYLKGDFRLQYLDKDFSDFVNLESVHEIMDKDTSKVVVLSVPETESELDSSSISSAPSGDTQMLSDDSSSDFSSSPHTRGSTSRQNTWPARFPIPKFAYDTEIKLSNGNKQYRETGSCLKEGINKHDILEKLAEHIFMYEAYPSDEHLSEVARRLVQKHPCLQEPHGTWFEWKNSLKFKMGNYRSKLRKFCPEVAVNALTN
ncbi:uncharacterized protein LOC121430239 [Lytechinus variegatus]|uniref:uncharacterized protein LOC121430239 n=1 Tax=Lytechinus variegatus TaxID=7654 RepID=UPI001BB10801|nr:uncharacterized protein LOC121430239 [Lytechinus variegatus]